MCTWGGWSWILHIWHTTSSWPVVNCSHKEHRTDPVQVQMSSSAPLEPSAFDQALSMAVWHMKKFICHSWWQGWVCVYIYFSWNGQYLVFCCLLLVKDVPPLPKVPYKLEKEITQLYIWIIWICVTEKERWQGSWCIKCKHKKNQVFSANILWNHKQMLCVISK